MTFNLRPSRPDDVPALATLAHSVWHDHYRHIMPAAYLEKQYTLTHCLADLTTAQTDATQRPRHHLLSAVFTESGQLGGFVRMASGKTVHAEDDAFLISGFDAELEQLYVTDTYRHIGLGQKLLRDAAAWCRDNDKSTVCLWTFTQNKSARDFYQKHGATLFQETSYYYVDRDVPLQIWQWDDFPNAILGLPGL